MKLTKESYLISKGLAQQLLSVLGERWFISRGDGDQDNDDDVIAADKALQAEIEKQEEA